ncbi:MAG: NADH-quinone oxidoreductase subunit I [Desulfobulbaceae bacterium]|nr:NADH-quinone oxidoreductase subunit I [Desulfobulbaceae bacterium]MCK5340649.1 NADH-quinone oxidoreductase subunit I [Desulfobulbaceae bacterium]MCK5403648.1 NADH-quinone oxidoreductase subunit I [Desulfobulbaceae bacterium]
MSGYFKELISGTYSLAVGLGITIKYFTQPVVTMQYPMEHVKMTPRYRGHIELVRDEETGASKCIVCGMCQKSCPSGCITVAGKKPEGSKKKVLTTYRLDFTKCSLCGLCVESCKPGALDFSKDYNLASPRKEDYIFDLLKRLEEKS